MFIVLKPFTRKNENRYPRVIFIKPRKIEIFLISTKILYYRYRKVPVKNRIKIGKIVLEI